MKTWKVENGDVALDVHGRIEEIGGSLKVVKDLKNWLVNDLGFNNFHPEMGSRLDNYVGQEVTARLLYDIRSEVRDILEKYMNTQMADLRKRIEERGDPMIAIGLAEPSSLVKSWTQLQVTQLKTGEIQIYIEFVTFTDDIEEVVLVVTSGIDSTYNLSRYG